MLSKFRYLSVFVLAFSVPMLVGLVSSDSAMAVSAVAAEEKKEPKYKDVKTRKRASVGRPVPRLLTKCRVRKVPLR